MLFLLILFIIGKKVNELCLLEVFWNYLLDNWNIIMNLDMNLGY